MLNLGLVDIGSLELQVVVGTFFANLKNDCESDKDYSPLTQLEYSSVDLTAQNNISGTS